MEFDAWKERVNTEVERICGMGCDDLPDYDYQKAHTAKKSPEATARAVVRAADPLGAKLVRDHTAKRRTPPKFSEWREEVRVKLNALHSLSLPDNIRELFDRGLDPAAAVKVARSEVTVTRTGDPADANGDEFEA